MITSFWNKTAARIRGQRPKTAEINYYWVHPELNQNTKNDIKKTKQRQNLKHRIKTLLNYN